MLIFCRLDFTNGNVLPCVKVWFRELEIMEGDNNDSENEIDSREHKQFIENVLNLNTRQYVNKPTRTEPTPHISEYNLIKSLRNNKDTVRLYDLTKSLKNKAGEIELRKKVKKTEVKSKTLAKPLEKPQAEQIKRSVAYENVKKQLDRWEPIVTSNRVSTNLSFPLKDPNFDYKEARDFASNWVLKSNLEKELEKLKPKVETFEVQTDTKFPMTLKQMIQKRKEMAKMRQYQSYKEIKARWQNKIKSKTFRRIQRKEKVKEQMKEFELLQKINPEAALKKLEEIEKARAEERASLRHKSTGKWARNQQIRAKYDKESRKVLAEQLAVSKDLMQKQQLDESNESEDDESDSNIINNQNIDNVWNNEIKPTKEVEDFVSEYKKFSENQNAKKSEILKIQNNDDEIDKSNNVRNEIINDNKTLIDLQKTKKKNQESSKNNTKRKLKKSKDKIIIRDKTSNQKRKKIQHQKDFQIDCTSEVWEVTAIDKEDDTLIDDVFDNIQYKVKAKVDSKFKKFKSNLENSTTVMNKKSKGGNATVVKHSSNDIAILESSKMKSVPNQEFSKSIESVNQQNTSAGLKELKSIIESESQKPTRIKGISYEKITKEPVPLNTAKPDLLSYDDNEESTDQNGVMMEAFDDNDIVEEFAKDKKHEIEKGNPKDIDLSLPGWGSWGGKNVPIPKRKKKRFILKAPKKFPRKDMNRGNLIINESANDNVKSHLVSDVPFPFKTVKDYEASIRAPIGNTFVPETAFRKMIKPTLQTKMGAIIEPMTEDILLHRQQKRKCIN